MLTCLPLACSVGKLMKDGSALSTYDIQDGHTVHLVAKPIQSAAPASAPNASSAAHATASNTTGPRFTFANRDDDDDFVGNAVRRNREYLRRLMSSEDTLNREDAESEASRRRNLREPSVIRPQTTSRRRIPGPGEPTGAAWNMGVLREALGGQGGGSGASDAADETAARLHGLRELFGDDVLEEASLSSVASEMGLGPTVLNASGSSANEPRANLDHVIQGMMTLRTVLSTVAVQPEVEQRSEMVRSEIDEEENNEDTEINLPNQPTTTSFADDITQSRLRRGPRCFFVGQWLDVKDTVNQWLECTVMDISEDKVLIHYHGWPSRWDEWIDFDSNRIAAFRTRTVHTVNSQHMSPMPLTRLPNAPSIGSPDLREMVAGVRDLMREIMPQVERFADLCEEQARSREQEDAQSFDASDASRDNAFSLTTSTQRRDEDISEMAHLITPIFDRFGRLLADSARCLEPMLRPELRSYNQQRQVQQTRAIAARNRTSRQQASAPSALESEDSSLSLRDLISTTMVNPNDSQGGRRNIDVHIHAIVAPSSLTSLASLARAASNASILQPTNATASRRLRAPQHPPVSFGFEEAFGLPDLREPVGNSDARALINDEAEDELDNDRESGDHSRMPLLGSFRRQEGRTSSSIGEARRRRTVDQNMENFLADDFFGTSFNHDDEQDDDAAAPANSRSPATSTRGSSFQYQSIPSPSVPSNELQRYGDSSTDNSLGVIPEVAEANERAREREERSTPITRLAGHETHEIHPNEERNRGDSSASSSSSSSSNGTSYPSFLEFMRRSLSRNFGFSSTSERRQSDIGEDDIPTLEPLRSSLSSSSSSSSSSSFPASPSRGIGDAFRTRRLSSANSIEEEMDQVD